MGSLVDGERFGPNHASVEAFLESLQEKTDAELWAIEEVVAIPPPNCPDTRTAAETSGRLLAWYEAGHYAGLAPKLHRDGTMHQEYPGQALVSSFSRVRAAATCIAQALVVGDLLPTEELDALLRLWPAPLP